MTSERQDNQAVSIGDRVAGRFVVEALIGRGGMSAVYRAIDERGGDPVALKFLDGAAPDAERFAREAELLAELAHPAVVGHVASGVHRERPYLVMQWLRGCDLAERLAEGPLAVAAVIALGRRLCEGLAAIHQRGVVHRDIKPSNLFLVDRDPGAACLVDFGIARRSDDPARLTKTGVMLGTVGYMAPEQIRAAADLDERADLFSLGCVLYECLTGAPPFHGANAVAVLAKVLVEAVTPTRLAAPEVPGDLAELVDRLLAKEPGQRPASAAEVGRRLAEIAGGIDASGPAARTMRHLEQRVICAIMIGPDVALESRADELVEIAGAFGGRVTRVAEGTAVITFDASGGAAGRAVRAALCASRLRSWLDHGGVAITSGKSYAAEHAAAGAALDRASQLVSAPGDGVKLDTLTAGLLGDRFRLEALGDAWLLGPEQQSSTGPRAAGTLLGRAAPCVGRKKELALLAATVDEVEEDSVARVILLSGPPGIGKSRIAAELIASMRGRGWRTLRASSTPLTTSADGAALRQLVLDAFQPFERETRFETIAARVAELELESADRVAEFLGELVGSPTPAPPSPQLRAARADPGVMRRWLATSLGDWLAAECARRPLMCALEDLHWADASSLAVFERVLARLRESPVLVLAMARPELGERYPRLWPSASVQVLAIERLTRAAASKLVSRSLPDAGPEIVAPIVGRGDGNPFFLEELIRAVAAGSAELPETVIAVAQERIERQDVATRRALRAASIFGERCWPGGVARLLGESSAHAGALLDSLVDAELLQPRDDSRFAGEPEYAFRHALLRDAAYAMVPDDERSIAHGRAARWLETAGEAEPIVLVEHWDRAGDPARARRWLRAAIESSWTGAEISSLLESAARGSRLADGPTGRAPFRLAEARARAFTCDYDRVLELYPEILPYLEVGSSDWSTMLGIVGYAGLVLGDQAAVAFTIETLAGGLAALEPSGPAALAVTTASAPALLVSGRDAYAPFEAALESMDERCGDDDLVVRGWCCHARSQRAMYMRDDGDAEAVAMVERERRCFQMAGDALAHAIATGWSAYCLAATGAVELADERAAQASAQAGQGGTDVAERFGLVGATMVRLSVDPDEAQRRAEALLRDGGRSLEAVPRILCAHVAAERGDASAVVAQLAALDALPYLPGKVAARGFRGALSLAAGDASGALSEIEAALALAGASVSLPITRTYLHRLRVEALVALGEFAGAAAAARAGRARLETIAGELEASSRAQFWVRAPLVASSVQLFDETLGR